MNEIEDHPLEGLLNGIVKEAASQDDRFEIPMDAPIEEFKYHLKSHPRTILSAKFGDGKSFFLSKFEEEKKDDCLIITLHPVNYQVVENKDIFELIKRDILFQITVKGMLDENLDISDEAAWAFYIQNNCMGVLESVLSYLSILQSSPKIVSGVLEAVKGYNMFEKLRKKVMALKKDFATTDALEAFFDKCGNISVLEEDWVTKTIQDSIGKYKTDNPNKRVVLVIEDMDRLDPAHLFRILNVFSAHLDTNEKYFVELKEPYFYNKFHFDNVVFVMDFHNTQRIFSHFYGEANFDGYIEKFVTKKIFEYSLKVEKYNYFIDRITTITDLPKKYVQAVLKPKCFEGKTIRAMVNSFENVGAHIIRYPIYDNKRLHSGILELYAIMKNLGVDGSEIVKSYKSVLTDNQIDVLPYIIGVLCKEWRLPQRYNKLNNKFILCRSIMDDKYYKYDVVVIKGYNSVNKCLDYSIEKMTTTKNLIEYLIENKVFVEDGLIQMNNQLRHIITLHIIDDLPKILDKYVA